MADVARLAGVSHQTVSRVLNQHPNVRPETREKVLAAIRELSYRPNAAARTLVTRRTHTLGVISFDTTLYGPASMLYGIEQAARHAYFVSIASLPALDHRRVLDAVDRFVGQAVEGIIVIAPQTSAVAALNGLPASVPLVAVGCGTEAPLASVAVDNTAGAARPPGTCSTWATRPCTTWAARGPGWMPASAPRAGGRRWPRPGRPSRSAGRRLVRPVRLRDRPAAGRRCLRSPRSSAPTTTWPSACCARCGERGRRVPDDVSVVGFDDIPESAFFLPPLTTVRQDFGELGRRAPAAADRHDLRPSFRRLAAAGRPGASGGALQRGPAPAPVMSPRTTLLWSMPSHVR